MTGRSERSYWVYIVTNVAGRSGTLYVGMTNDLMRRIAEHRFRANEGSFTSRYALTRLVYSAEFQYVLDAIAWERQIKGWLRSRKIELIEEDNPYWLDLSAGWFEEAQGAIRE